jgi:hypothetical protein
MIRKEYRVVYREGWGEYYPQVRTLLFGIPVSKWLRIGVHLKGEFGLYDSLEYPYATKEDADHVIWEYKTKRDNPKFIYIPYE